MPKSGWSAWSFKCLPTARVPGRSSGVPASGAERWSAARGRALNFFNGRLHSWISPQESSPGQFYNAGLDYRLRPASRSAIWGTLITRAVPFHSKSCYQEGVTPSGGCVYRRKEGIASGAWDRGWKFRVGPSLEGLLSESLGLSLRRRTWVKLRPGGFQAVRACTYSYTHSLTRTRSHPLTLTPETGGRKARSQ